jgi:hypothetical protein
MISIGVNCVIIDYVNSEPCAPNMFNRRNAAKPSEGILIPTTLIPTTTRPHRAWAASAPLGNLWTAVCSTVPRWWKPAKSLGSGCSRTISE